MSRWSKKARAPKGFEVIEPTLATLESELRDRMNDPHEGMRKVEALWPVHQINWQRSRYVWDMFKIHGRISREVYDYCVRMKLVDPNLIAKWKKPGYERLCTTYAINTKNFNHGTVSICRVPRKSLAEGQVVQSQFCGCRGCGSGDGGYQNIFGNKYGQYLAAIQVAREGRQAAAAAARQEEEEEEEEAAAAAVAAGGEEGTAAAAAAADTAAAGGGSAAGAAGAGAAGSVRAGGAFGGVGAKRVAVWDEDAATGSDDDEGESGPMPVPAGGAGEDGGERPAKQRRLHE
jgi:bud site selection protein 31